MIAYLPFRHLASPLAVITADKARSKAGPSLAKVDAINGLLQRGEIDLGSRNALLRKLFALGLGLAVAGFAGQTGATAPAGGTPFSGGNAPAACGLVTASPGNAPAARGHAPSSAGIVTSLAGVAPALGGIVPAASGIGTFFAGGAPFAFGGIPFEAIVRQFR